MGHGSAVPMQVYRLPEGVKYLVIEYDARDAAALVAALGPEAVHLAIDDDDIVSLYIDNSKQEALARARRREEAEQQEQREREAVVADTPAVAALRKQLGFDEP